MKLTDEQIIKDLECCMTENGNDCDNCSYSDVIYKQGEGGCCNKLMKDALDLINRQKAENIELQLKNSELKVEKERDYSIGYHLGEKQGIKEFVERLKKKLLRYPIGELLDNLVKEMAGE